MTASSDNRTLNFGEVGNTCVRPNNGIFDHGLFLDMNSGSQNGIYDLCVWLDHASLPKHRELIDLGGSRNVGPGRSIDVEASYCTIHKVAMSSEITIRGPDIAPIFSVHHIREKRDALLEDRRKNIVFKGPVLAFGYEVEYQWLQYVDSRVDGIDSQRGELLRPRFFYKSQHFTVLANFNEAVPRRVVHRHQRDRRGGFPFLVQRDHFLQIDICEDIAVKDHRRFVIGVGGKSICAPGTHRTRLGDEPNVYTKFVTVIQNCFYLVRLIT